MAKEKSGGPAFPQSLSPDGPFGGMSLRAWIATHALASIIEATADYEMVNAMATGTKGGMLETKAAVAWADALIAVLQIHEAGT